MQKYFDILGISETATEKDIKKSFKEKAKLLHPDINKSLHAHEEFLELYDAFNWALTNLRNPQKNFQTGASIITQKQQDREQAIRYAKMRYEKWTKTKEYKDLTDTKTIQEFLGSIFILFILVSILGILGKITELKYGAIAGITIGCIFSIVIIKRNDLRIFNILKFFKAISDLISVQNGIIILLFIINIIVFLKIGLNTLITIHRLFGLYSASFLLVHLNSIFILKFKKNYLKKIVLSAIIISILLCLNFYISSCPTTKTYKLEKQQNDTLLELENNQFEEYIGIRIFGDIDNLPLLKSIQYTFKKGLFGYYVVSNTELLTY